MSDMMFTTALSLFLLAWSGVFLLDFVLRALSFRRYVDFVEKHDIQISPFQLRCYTHKYDRVDLTAAPDEIRLTKRLRALWFDAGVIVALACTVFMTWYLSAQVLWSLPSISTLYGSSTPKTDRLPTPSRLFPQEQLSNAVFAGDGDRIDHPGEDEGLIPIVPGVNMPWAHIPVFMAVLVMAAVLHELGHAWAATGEHIHVSGFGVFVVGIYPGAFTEIDDGTLQQSGTWSRLRVYCGGVWHNIVLAAAGCLLVYSAPTLLSPLFISGQGVTVEEVSHDSGLHGGLFPGQVVVGLDDCQVFDPHSWMQCVRAVQTEKYGRCVDADTVQRAGSEKITVFDSEVHCCEENRNATPAHICFESESVSQRRHKETRAPSLADTLRIGKREVPREVVRVESKLSRRLSCLDARWVSEQPTCNASKPCETVDGQVTPPVCVFPALYNGTRLVRVDVGKELKPVLFVGRVEEFVFLVEVSSLVSRWSWVPRILPHSIELFGKYIVTLSLALGVLNAVPCYALDGQHIVITVVQRIFRMYPKRRRHQLIRLVLVYGTLLLASNILIGFLKLFRSIGVL